MIFCTEASSGNSIWGAASPRLPAAAARTEILRARAALSHSEFHLEKSTDDIELQELQTARAEIHCGAMSSATIGARVDGLRRLALASGCIGLH